MVKEVQFRRGSTSDHTSGVGFTGALAEVTVDTTNKTLRVHDGSTKGGHELVGVAATQRITNKDIEATTLIVSGVTTLPNVSRINVTGVSTFALINVTGISTFTNGPVFIGSGTSTGTVSQPLQVTGGAYVSGNLGIGSTNPGERLQVDGNLRLGVSTTSNYIAFYGTTGDGPGSYNHTYIGERVWTTGTERSELLLFKGNDADASNGWDRIRLAGGQVRIDTYTAATSGTFEGIATSTNLTNRVVVHSTGEVGIGSDVLTGTVSQPLQVTGGAYVSGNLGVGVTNPSYKLDVTGVVRLGNSVAQGNPSISDITVNAHTILSGQGGNYLSIGQYGSSNNFAQWIQSGFTVPSTATYNIVLQPLGGNIGISVTNPTAELHIEGTGSAAASSAPLKISVASTTLLTTPESGAFEYDRVLLYHTNDDTTNANRRALVPEIQFIRRPDNLSINDTTSPGTSFFGATNRPALLGGYIYEIEAVVFVTKVTNAGTVTVQASLSTGNFTFATLQANTASNAIVVGGTVSPVTIFTSASLTAGTSHGITIKGLVQPASNSRLDLLAFSSTATITALSNSYMKVTCVGTGTTIGNFG